MEEKEKPDLELLPERENMLHEDGPLLSPADERRQMEAEIAAREAAEQKRLQTLREQDAQRRRELLNKATSDNITEASTSGDRHDAGMSIDPLRVSLGIFFLGGGGLRGRGRELREEWRVFCGGGGGLENMFEREGWVVVDFFFFFVTSFSAIS